MIAVQKDGKAVDLKTEEFKNEGELKQRLLANIHLIPASDISEDDERIIAWRPEFPLGTGSADILAVGDGGGIYLVETKLLKNKDRREAVAQALDYAASLWLEYGRDPEAFLEKLEEGGQGEVPDDEEFQRNLRQNLRDASYNILIAMDGVEREVKNLIEFMNKHTDFKVLALEVERYVGEGLEVVVPRTYGEEITRDPPPPPPPEDWPPEKIRNALAKVDDQKLKDRLSKILDFAVREGVFVSSRTQSPQFGLKAAGRVLSIYLSGSLYALFGRNERGKYYSDQSRYEFVEGLKALGMLPQDLNPDDVVSGRGLNKRLGELTEEEFEKLFELLKRHLKREAR